MPKNDTAESVRNLTDEISKVLDGESLDTCLTALCLSTAMAITSCDASGDETAVGIYSAQVRRMINFLRQHENTQH